MKDNEIYEKVKKAFKNANITELETKEIFNHLIERREEGIVFEKKLFEFFKEELLKDSQVFCIAINVIPTKDNLRHALLSFCTHTYESTIPSVLAKILELEVEVDAKNKIVKFKENS